MELFRRGCVLCGNGAEPLCGTCGAGLPPPPATAVRDVGPVPALFAYEAGGARVVQALKFRDGRRLVAPLADGLIGLVPHQRFDAVTWIPTTRSRRTRRGFDQAELLASALARRLERRCRALLRRPPGPSQTGLERKARADNVSFVPRPVHRTLREVVVVDDVCTTGASIRAARLALARAGIGATFVVVARTP